MNNIAIIFQRNNAVAKNERENEEARLGRYAAQHGLKVVSTFVALGPPSMLTIDTLINGCIARAKPGHLIVTAVSRLWDGDNPAAIIGMVERAGAIVHVVPEEFP